nr:uncharacterized protein LOC104104073 [Nicotiana tomentosiformis]
MGSEMEIVEQRLKAFAGQLQTEFAILDRLVYKNKNQHRRCSYFQYLLKVRRDLRLLQAANLEEVLSSSFQVLYGKRPKQKVQLLESLKRRRCDGGKHNFLERLLGVAHLLLEIVEPMLRAATEISTLLARSFFMGFSLTILALLARIRVLVQQMLLDVVCVFNSVSSLSQREQAIRLTQDGFEVFREYFPPKQHVVFLECLWKSDKYVLVERQNERDVGIQEKEVGEDVSVEASKIQYESIEIFLGDEEPGKTTFKDLAEDDGQAVIDKDKANSLENRKDLAEDVQAVMDKDKANSLQDPIQESSDEFRTQVGSVTAGPSGNNFNAPEDGASPNINPAKAKPELKNNVAFISATKNELEFCILGMEKGDNPSVDKEDPFSLP